MNATSTPTSRKNLEKQLRQIERTNRHKGEIAAWEMRKAFAPLFKAASSVVSTNGNASSMKALCRVVEELRPIDAERQEVDRLSKQAEQIYKTLTEMED